MEEKLYLNILFKAVGELPILMKIENTLKARQDLIGNAIEVIPYKGALLLYNNENTESNLAFNYGHISGNCFVVGDDYLNGAFKSLTDTQIKEIFDDLQKRSIKSGIINIQNIFNNSLQDKYR